MNTTTNNILRINERVLIGRRTTAKYNDVVLPLNQGNPLIEALPPLRTKKEVLALFSKEAPAYQLSERTRPERERRELTSTLFQVFIPLNRHLYIEEAITNGISGSYSYRNPLNHKYMLQQIQNADAIDFESNDYEEPMVGASCLIGWAGTGKTRSLKRALIRACPQVIDHTSYKETKLGISQLTWLYVSCAHDGSVKDLCLNIAGAMDVILGTQYKKLVEAGRTEHGMARAIAGITALHTVGLIVIDEVQNACIGRPIERQRLTRFITKLMNSMSTRIMLVGTPEANDALMRDMPLLRRTIGESGQIPWNRIETVKEWGRFMRGIWRYQYTATETKLTRELAYKILTLTLGIPDLAVKLYCMAQKEVIGNKRYHDEKITEEVFEYVMRTRMAQAELVLKRMRADITTSSEWNHPRVQQIWLDMETKAETTQPDHG